MNPRRTPKQSQNRIDLLNRRRERKEKARQAVKERRLPTYFDGTPLKRLKRLAGTGAIFYKRLSEIYGIPIRELSPWIIPYHDESLSQRLERASKTGKKIEMGAYHTGFHEVFALNSRRVIGHETTHGVQALLSSKGKYTRARKNFYEYFNIENTPIKKRAEADWFILVFADPPEGYLAKNIDKKFRSFYKQGLLNKNGLTAKGITHLRGLIPRSEIIRRLQNAKKTNIERREQNPKLYDNVHRRRN